MRIISPQSAVLALSLGIAALFLISSVPVQAGYYPHNNTTYELSWQDTAWPWSDHDGNQYKPIEKTFTSYRVLINGNAQSGALGLYGPPYNDLNGTIAWDERNTAALHVDQFYQGDYANYKTTMVLGGQNPSVRWLLAEWDSCYMNANGTISRIHHSDYNNSHTGVSLNPNGAILQNDWWTAFNFYGETNLTDTEPAQKVRWVENLYINGSSSLVPFGNVFMDIPPHIYVPVIFRETYYLRADFDGSYASVPSLNLLPNYPAVIDGAGLPSIQSWATGSMYVDRQQLDAFLANDSLTGHLNLTPRAELYAWSLMLGLRISDLTTRLVSITHQGGLGTDASRTQVNGESLIWLAENYRLAALALTQSNGTASDIINATKGAWMDYEAANYYQAAAATFNIDNQPASELAQAASWEAQAYALTSEEYADAAPDYATIYQASEIPANSTGVFEWLIDNWALFLSIAGLALSVLAAIIKNPWFLIVSILITVLGILGFVGWL